MALKTGRLRWHPDRFNLHPEMVAKAGEVFKAVNRLYELER